MGIDLGELTKAVQAVIGGVQLAPESGNLGLGPTDLEKAVRYGELAKGKGSNKNQDKGRNADLEIDRLFVGHGEVDGALDRQLAALSACFFLGFLSKCQDTHLPISSVMPIAWANISQLLTFSPEGTSSSIRWIFMPTVSAMVLHRG